MKQQTKSPNLLAKYWLIIPEVILTIAAYNLGYKAWALLPMAAALITGIILGLVRKLREERLWSNPAIKAKDMMLRHLHKKSSRRPKIEVVITLIELMILMIMCLAKIF